MEPGHEDREYTRGVAQATPEDGPQWSPVMKTGNTRFEPLASHHQSKASMEPGHEDREYIDRAPDPVPHRLASMEPGHEDREYLCGGAGLRRRVCASMEPGHEDREYRDGIVQP